MREDIQKPSEILGKLAFSTKLTMRRISELNEELNHHAAAHECVEKGIPEELVGHAVGAGLNTQNLLGLLEQFGLQLAVQVLNQLLLGQVPKPSPTSTGNVTGITGTGPRGYTNASAQEAPATEPRYYRYCSSK